MLVEPADGAITDVRPLPVETVEAVQSMTAAHGRVEPLLFAMVDGRDRVCWREAHTTPFVDSFLARRRGNPRLLPLPGWSALGRDRVFYATLIGTREDIVDLRDRLDPYLDGCFVTVGPDAYSPDQTWLEICSRQATKAAAIARLQGRLRTGELVVFGDNLNDEPMFEIADHACAVANAVPELRGVAAEVIPSNDDDGVADWLEGHVLDRAR